MSMFTEREFEGKTKWMIVGKTPDDSYEHFIYYSGSRMGKIGMLWQLLKCKFNKRLNEHYSEIYLKPFSPDDPWWID